MRHSSLWHRIFAGVLMGIGCILPGVSGGVMAVCFGLYFPMLDAVLGFFKNPRQSCLFLWPLGVGGAVGLWLGAKGLAVVMARFEIPMLFLFIGFILGGIPELLREANQGKPFRLRNLLFVGAGIALALPLLWLPKSRTAAETLSVAQALLTGGIEGVGTIVPGLSASFLLMFLGWYQAYLTAFATLNLASLVPIALGFCASAFVSMKGVKWLFDRHRAAAYSGVLGFLLVSIALVFPGLEAGRGLWVDLLMLVLGLLGALWMGKSL
ncbi:MAG: DUF368 domain-containing protein [Clostridia bacterium]